MVQQDQPAQRIPEQEQESWTLQCSRQIRLVHLLDLLWLHLMMQVLWRPQKIPAGRPGRHGRMIAWGRPDQHRIRRPSVAAQPAACSNATRRGSAHRVGHLGAARCEATSGAEQSWDHLQPRWVAWHARVRWQLRGRATLLSALMRQPAPIPAQIACVAARAAIPRRIR